MNSRETIIKRIKRNSLEIKPLPDRFPGTEPFSDEQLLMGFKENLVKAGGEILEPGSSNEPGNYLETHFPEAINLTRKADREKYSSAPKEELEKVQTVIVPGQLGVAENGAVWIDETNLPNRLLPFVTEQLVVVLNGENMVADMVEAYRSINLGDVGFGVFISGPSKTADIEQSLVYGAHGAKKLVVVLNPGHSSQHC
jgi:L-lactate dehydrogenase complex protein LldG